MNSGSSKTGYTSNDSFVYRRERFQRNWSTRIVTFSGYFTHWTWTPGFLSAGKGDVYHSNPYIQDQYLKCLNISELTKHI